MYNTLLLKKKGYPTSEIKWNEEIEVTHNDENLFTTFKYTIESSLHWFQLLYWILLTNNYLHKIGLFNSHYEFWEALFQNLEISSPTNSILKNFFFSFLFVLSPHQISRFFCMQIYLSQKCTLMITICFSTIWYSCIIMSFDVLPFYRYTCTYTFTNSCILW